MPLARGDEPRASLLDDLMRRQAAEDFTLSADGRWLAVELHRLAPGYVYRGEPTIRNALLMSLQIRDAQTGAVVWTSGEEHRRVSTPSFSPDGRQLAFLAENDGVMQLWIWSARTKEARRAPGVTPRFWTVLTGLVWTPDSQQLVFAVDPEGSTPQTLKAALGAAGGDADYPMDRKTPGARVALYRSNATTPPVQDYASNNFRAGDLVRVDVATGEWKRLMRGGYRPDRYRISPDNRWIVFTHLKGNDQGSGYRLLFDVVAIPAAGGAPKVLARDVLQSQQNMDVSWSPDGRSVAFFDTGPGARKLCYLVDVSSGRTRTLPTTDWIFRGPVEMPVWSADSRQFHVRTAGGVLRIDARTLKSQRLALPADKEANGLLVSRDSDTLLVRARDRRTLDEGIFRFDPRSSQFTALVEAPMSLSGSAGRAMELDRSGRWLVYGSQHSNAPTQLWKLDTQHPSPQLLADFNPQLSRHEFGRSRLVSWRGLEGETAYGALLLPPGHTDGKPVSLIVYLYGDDALSRDLNLFGLTRIGMVGVYENMQLLATRGHAILRPDTRTRVGTPMRDIADSLLPGVDKLVADGIVDPKRLGVMGRSYGGYSVLSLLVQSPRFKAAICVAGDSNLTTLYTQMMPDGTTWKGSWAEEGQGKMGGTVWERRASYIDNSPYFYLDRVTTPLLVAHGTADTAVPFWSSDDIFQSLRRLGREVEYARYFDEPHVIAGWANSFDYANRMMEWFERL